MKLLLRKSHVKAHWRTIDGKKVHVREHDDKRHPRLGMARLRKPQAGALAFDFDTPPLPVRPNVRKPRAKTPDQARKVRLAREERVAGELIEEIKKIIAESQHPASSYSSEWIDSLAELEGVQLSTTWKNRYEALTAQSRATAEAMDRAVTDKERQDLDLALKRSPIAGWDDSHYILQKGYIRRIAGVDYLSGGWWENVVDFHVPTLLAARDEAGRLFEAIPQVDTANAYSGFSPRSMPVSAVRKLVLKYGMKMRTTEHPSENGRWVWNGKVSVSAPWLPKSLEYEIGHANTLIKEDEPSEQQQELLDHRSWEWYEEQDKKRKKEQAETYISANDVKEILREATRHLAAEAVPKSQTDTEAAEVAAEKIKAIIKARAPARRIELEAQIKALTGPILAEADKLLSGLPPASVFPTAMMANDAKQEWRRDYDSQRVVEIAGHINTLPSMPEQIEALRKAEKSARTPKEAALWRGSVYFKPDDKALADFAEATIPNYPNASASYKPKASEGISPAVKKAVSGAAAVYRKHCHPEALEDRKLGISEYKRTEGSRRAGGYASGSNVMMDPEAVEGRTAAEIVSGKREPVNKTAVHEIAHTLEHQIPEWADLAQSFLSARTAGDDPVMLKKLQSGWGYDDWEVTRPDRFVEPYTGKYYASFGSTEVVTMALQEILTGPKRSFELFQKDPEHWALGIALLRLPPSELRKYGFFGQSAAPPAPPIPKFKVKK